MSTPATGFPPSVTVTVAGCPAGTNVLWTLTDNTCATQVRQSYGGVELSVLLSIPTVTDVAPGRTLLEMSLSFVSHNCVPVPSPLRVGLAISVAPTKIRLLNPG